MDISRGEQNPLRPYYRPPSIGIPQDTPGTTSSRTHSLGPRNGNASSYASSAREMFSDIDYSDYMSDASPSTIESIRKTLDEALYRYVSVLLSQPFDVAKTVLQVRRQNGQDGLESAIEDGSTMRDGTQSRRDDKRYSDYPSDDDSDLDEPAYFTSSAPSSSSYSPRSRRQHSYGDRTLSPPPKSPKSQHQLILKNSESIMEVISQEWTKEGTWGVWKGSNATFVYAFLLKTVESWSRGVFSAMFNVPDAGVMGGLGAITEVADSPYPWASLVVAVAASVATGLILAPLDLIRTKLILTPISLPKRSLIHNLRNLPSYLCPSTLIIPTILHSLITPTINHSTPLLLRTYLAIDPVLTPVTYSFFKFMSRTVELFLKLPLETILRRGQMSILASPSYRVQGGKDLEPMVDIGPYKGVIGTMWSIVREEGTSSREIAVGSKKKGKKVEHRGQGIEGLWRGWRVGMWALVGVWGARAMSGGGNSGGEF